MVRFHDTYVGKKTAVPKYITELPGYETTTRSIITWAVGFARVSLYRVSLYRGHSTLMHTERQRSRIYRAQEQRNRMDPGRDRARSVFWMPTDKQYRQFERVPSDSC